MATPRHDVDNHAPSGKRDRSRAEEAFDLLGGMMTAAHVAGLVGLGVRLGLYQAMAGRGALTAGQVADAAGLAERWVREWLYGQAAAGVVEHDGDGRFRLTDEVAAFLADPASLLYLGGNFSGLPHRLAVVPALEEAFRTGVGLSFDDRGPDAAADTEMLFANWYRQVLVPVALPKLEGVVDRLEEGTRAADIGCGSGIAVIEMAKAFPASEFSGYDVSAHALERAEAHRAEAGVGNATFHDARRDPLPEDARFGLVTTFDCLHDMTRPEETVRAIRRAIRPDGAWLIADIACAPTFAENLRRPRLSAMLYSISVYSCLSSSLSEPGGAGLGTCGLPEPALRELVTSCGFASLRRLDIDHPVNAFYEARP